MKTLSIDIETYSDVQLPKTGVYRYCESDNFEILLFAYSVDSQPVQVIDLACASCCLRKYGMYSPIYMGSRNVLRLDSLFLQVLTVNA